MSNLEPIEWTNWRANPDNPRLIERCGVRGRWIYWRVAPLGGPNPDGNHIVSKHLYDPKRNNYPDEETTVCGLRIDGHHYKTRRAFLDTIGALSKAPIRYTIRMRAADLIRWIDIPLARRRRAALQAALQAPTSEELFDAVEKGDCGRVWALVAAGIDVHGGIRNGWTIMHLATHKAICAGVGVDVVKPETRVEVIDVLRSGGADINARGLRDGETPVMMAASHCKVELVQKLIERGADTSLDPRARAMVIKETGSEGRGRLGLLTLLRASSDGREWLESSVGKWHAFVWAVSDGDCEGVRKSLAGGSDPNARDGSGTPIMQLAFHVADGWGERHMSPPTSVIDLLIDAGADVNATDSMGKTSLLLAAECEDAIIVQRLIERGADPQLKDKKGRTVLGTVLSQKDRRRAYRRVLSVLVDATADGRAWLQSAGGKEWSRLYLEIDPTAPLPVCREDLTDAISAALEGKNSDGLSAIQRWVEEGGDLGWRGTEGRTLLHIAARYGNDSMVRLLLKNGADIESRTTRGETPILLACDPGYPYVLNPSVVATLLDHGADPNVSNCDGMTPLRLIRRVEDRGDAKQIVKLLESGGSRLVPGDTVQCPECGAPNGPSMLQRGVHATVTGETFALFPCRHCSRNVQVSLYAITNDSGARVRCPSCAHTNYLPPSVWCLTCGKSLSSGWQQTISLE
jgi:ankyrin repeat protein